MACPICGANCVCRKRGPGGICCDCHRHKVGGRRLAKGSPELQEWRQQHGYILPDETHRKHEPAAAEPAAAQLDLFNQEPAK